MQQMWAHSQAPLPPIRDLRPDVPEAVAAILKRMLAKNANERFSNPKEVAESLQPFTIDCNLAEFVGTLRRTTTSRMDLSRVSSAHSRPSGSVVKQPGKTSRRSIVIGAGVAAGVLLTGVLAIVFRSGGDNHLESNHGAGSGDVVGNNANKQIAPPSGIPVKVGVLHSRTGTMAISERAVIRATSFAIEEINAAGGVLGRPVEAVVEDGESDPAVFAVKCEKLIVDDGVCTGHSEQVAKRLRPLAGTGFGF